MPPKKKTPAPAKKTTAKAATSAAVQTGLTEVQRQAPPRPKGDDLGTDVMRNRQKRWLDRAKQGGKQTATSKATSAVGKVAGPVAKLAGPAVTVGQALGGPSQAPKQVDRQVANFEKNNPGWTIVRTKTGYRTVKKPPKPGATKNPGYRESGGRVT